MRGVNTMPSLPTTVSAFLRGWGGGSRLLALLAAFALVASAVFFAGGAPPARAAHTLDAPANLTATPGDGEVVLSWDAVTGADRYRIEYGEQFTWFGQLTPLDVQVERRGEAAPTRTDVSATTGTISGLTNGKFYLFRVRSYDSGGTHTQSEFSDWVSVMPRAANPTLVGNLGQTGTTFSAMAPSRGRRGSPRAPAPRATP